MEVQQAARIKLTDLIAPAFYKVHKDIKEGRHEYYNLYGGRGSGKSSFVSVELPLGMMQNPEANAAVFHKFSAMLRDSVYNQIQWGIDALGVSDYWRGNVNPMQFTYLPTGQKIIFRGLDKAQKTKSIKAATGFFKYLWFEELDIFKGPEEIRMAEQSVLRGGHNYVVFKTFNPPINRNNWANKYVQIEDRRAYNHKSDYRSVPREWLGDEFFDSAEHLRLTNPRAYDHEYLGNAVGTGGNIFELLELREITDEEIARMDTIYQGVDFGWYPDAYAFVRCYYDADSETIYFIDEHYVNKESNEITANWIKEKGYTDYHITCDSAEPKSINDYRSMGLPARPAIKGPGSVEYGMKWLMRRKIVIDKRRTPNLFREFTEYEYDRDKDGNIISGYPDANNHSIDATRYAFESKFNRRGNTA